MPSKPRIMTAKLTFSRHNPMKPFREFDLIVCLSLLFRVIASSNGRDFLLHIQFVLFNTRVVVMVVVVVTRGGGGTVPKCVFPSVCCRVIITRLMASRCVVTQKVHGIIVGRVSAKCPLQLTQRNNMCV